MALTLTVEKTTLFRRDLKRAMRRPDAEEIDAALQEVIGQLRNRKPLPPKNRDHALVGIKARDCHVRPDWVLIYAVEGDTLTLIRTGTHSALGLA